MEMGFIFDQHDNGKAVNAQVPVCPFPLKKHYKCGNIGSARAGTWKGATYQEIPEALSARVVDSGKARSDQSMRQSNARYKQY